MTTRPVAKTGLHLIAGCSLALLVGAGCGTAFAHGGGHNGGANQFSNGGGQFSNGGDHAGNFGRGRCLGCGGGLASGTHYTGHNIDGTYWHHHHTGSGPGGLGTVHGPGSSHNPIIYHPPVRPVRLPIAGVGPAKLPKNPNPTFCSLVHAGAKVREHRSSAKFGLCGGHRY